LPTSDVPRKPEQAPAGGGHEFDGLRDHTPSRRDHDAVAGEAALAPASRHRRRRPGSEVDRARIVEREELGQVVTSTPSARSAAVDGFDERPSTIARR
jgi:hypothetical protein